MTKKSSKPRRSLLSGILIAVVLGGYGIAEHFGWLDPRLPEPQSGRRQTDGTPPAPRIEAGGTRAILDAYVAQRSDVVVEASGTVVRVLADDDDGSRHQRFVVELSGSDHTILIAHNIDLAARVPLAKGDPIEFRGEFEWNDQGGVVHWTHHDPAGRRPGGFVRHGGETYR